MPITFHNPCPVALLPFFRGLHDIPYNVDVIIGPPPYKRQRRCRRGPSELKDEVAELQIELLVRGPRRYIETLRGLHPSTSDDFLLASVDGSVESTLHLILRDDELRDDPAFLLRMFQPLSAL